MLNFLTQFFMLIFLTQFFFFLFIHNVLVLSMLRVWDIMRHCFHSPVFSHFGAILACDRQTDGHKMAAYTMLAQHHVVKMESCYHDQASFGKMMPALKFVVSPVPEIGLESESLMVT